MFPHHRRHFLQVRTCCYLPVTLPASSDLPLRVSHRDETTPPDCCAPYQIRLEDTEKLIFAPKDDDSVIRSYQEFDLGPSLDDQEEDFEDDE